VLRHTSLVSLAGTRAEDAGNTHEIPGEEDQLVAIYTPPHGLQPFEEFVVSCGPFCDPGTFPFG
jgi:hypothetical protein